MVTIRLVGYLRTDAGFVEKEIPIDGDIILRELIDFPQYGDHRVVVLINEKGGSLDAKIKDSDVVKILPVIGGG